MMNPIAVLIIVMGVLIGAGCQSDRCRPTAYERFESQQGDEALMPYSGRPVGFQTVCLDSQPYAMIFASGWAGLVPPDEEIVRWQEFEDSLWSALESCEQARIPCPIQYVSSHRAEVVPPVSHLLFNSYFRVYGDCKLSSAEPLAPLRGDVGTPDAPRCAKLISGSRVIRSWVGMGQPSTAVSWRASYLPTGGRLLWEVLEEETPEQFAREAASLGVCVCETGGGSFEYSLGPM